MAEAVAHPIDVLREHVTALEAALSVCLADPGHKPVHRLRTETRRVEALLLLLEGMPELPEHRKRADALSKALRRLRRAAGTVRDFDVHRKLLEAYLGEAEAQASEQGQGEPKNGIADQSDTQEQSLHQGAAALRDHMGTQRDQAATVLLKLLRRRQTTAARAAERLLKVLEPAGAAELGAAALVETAAKIAGRSGLLRAGEIENLTEDELHTVRKAAKAARYLAESLPGEPAAVAAAEHFESLQEAGGQWHDLLEVSRAARRYLGKRHPLSVALTAERDTHLKRYREVLEGEVEDRGAKPARGKGGQARKKTLGGAKQVRRADGAKPGKTAATGRTVRRRARA